MNRLKLKLSRLNGWRRMWLVLTILGILVASLVLPIYEATDFRNQVYRGMWKAQSNLENPDCRAYRDQAFETLPTPAFTDSEGKTGCYFLYSQRKFHNPTTVPYTEEQLRKDVFIQIWSYTGGTALVFSMVAIFLSALVYFVGFVISWIISGFNKNPSQ